MFKRVWMGAALGLALASAAAPPSLAQTGKPAAKQQAAKPATKPADVADLIDRYDNAALRSIVSELGYRISDSGKDSQDRPFLTVEPGGDAGTAFKILGQSCEGKGKDQVCQGIQLAAQFGANTDEEKASDLIESVNRTLRPAKLFWVGSGLAYERYIILDGGVSRENLKTNIDVFVEILRAIWDQM